VLVEVLVHANLLVVVVTHLLQKKLELVTLWIRKLDKSKLKEKEIWRELFLFKLVDLNVSLCENC